MSYTNIFDTHAHYDDERFDEDRREVLESLPGCGVNLVVNVGASLAGAKAAVELAHGYDFIYAAAGVHPNEVLELEEEGAYETLRSLLSDEKTVAVGEIGLDYHWDEPSRDIQKKHFIRQLELANELKMPVNIHSREAAADTLDIVTALGREAGGIVHCFSYPKEMAAKYVDMGYCIGVGGVVTFKNSRVLKEVVEYLPLEAIVLETDTPYLAPEPHRGERNTSLNLPFVAEQIAAIKNISPEKVISAARENALRAYRMEI